MTSPNPDLSQVEVDWGTVLAGVQGEHSSISQQLILRLATSEAAARRLQADLAQAREVAAQADARAAEAAEDVAQLRSMVLGAEAHAQTQAERIAELEQAADAAAGTDAPEPAGEASAPRQKARAGKDPGPS